MRIELQILIVYLIVINLISAIVCIADKIKAKRGEWRIKEGTLYLLCLLGGGPFMYATMLTIRHKTLHKRFMIGIPAIIVLQVLLCFLVYYSIKTQF